MSTKEKLIKRFKTLPKDFTWEEMVRLFAGFGFTVKNKGKTSGSRVMFENNDVAYTMHKPHPKNIIKETALKQLLKYLIEKKYIDNEQNTAQ